MGPEGSVGGVHSGGALGMTACGWLLLASSCQSSGSWLRVCRCFASPAANTCDACTLYGLSFLPCCCRFVLP